MNSTMIVHSLNYFFMLFLSEREAEIIESNTGKLRNNTGTIRKCLEPKCISNSSVIQVQH